MFTRDYVHQLPFKELKAHILEDFETGQYTNKQLASGYDVAENFIDELLAGKVTV